MSTPVLLTGEVPAQIGSVPTPAPLVSVVIPVKNDAARLAVCLSSLEHQDYPRECYEIIVIDNGSADDSAGVASRCRARVLVCPGLRVGALRNRGVASAAGEIVAFVDSDHELPTWWIRRGVDDLVANPTTKIVGSHCLAPPGGTWVQRTWELHRLRQRSRCEVSWLGAGNMFVRRADFDALGGFNECLVAAEDVDLCARIAQDGGRIISDLSLANIHHGEPRTLRQFFGKERWRGSSGIAAFIAHGMPLHELPSLAYPVYCLLMALLFVITGCMAIMTGLWWLPAIAAALMLTPALLLAVKTACQTRQPSALAPLTILYMTYGFARAAALFNRR